MKEKIYSLLDSKQIRWGYDEFGDCNVCGLNRKEITPHTCEAINELINTLNEEIYKIYE